MFPVVEKVETGSNFQYLIFHFSIQSILIDIFEVANPVKHPVGEKYSNPSKYITEIQ